MKLPIQLLVNGDRYDLEIEPRRTLLEVLREHLELTGARRGCETSFCGACTVLLEGKAVHACCVLAVQANGRSITTIEGLAQAPGQLHPLQQAFVEYGALQCGYCTPGVILSAKAFLDEQPHPSRAQVIAALTGNICRCTGYVKIVEAVLAVSQGNPQRKGS